MIASFRLFLTVMLMLLCGLSSIGQTKKTSETDYERGYRHWYYDKFDSAYLMFNCYVNSPDDSLKKGRAYMFMGDILYKLGDLYGAEENLTASLHTLDSLDRIYKEESRNIYTLLGNINQILEQYDEALNDYNSAQNFVEEPADLLELMNSKATLFQKKKDYSAAISIYDSILLLKPSDKSLVARAIHNRARTKWLQNSNSNVLPEFHAALKIRKDNKYTDGMIASYAHLSDFYSKNNNDSAFWYAKKMRMLAEDIKSPDDILEAIDKMIRLTDSSHLIQTWYNEYIQLNDSIQQSRNYSKNRFAPIRFDLKKSKAENVVLKKSVTRQQLLIYTVSACALIVITALSAWFIIRRKRLKTQSENAIRNASLKTSQRVHDVVANGLYSIMNELEHKPSLERDKLIIKIEDLYEKSRNISYEENATINMLGYDRQVHELLTGFGNEHTNIFIVGNQPIFWNNITPAQKQQLELILNEIMVNMKKHSQAKKVVIQFKQEAGTALIHYKDDGNGMPVDINYGNGLKNTVSRINSIGGAITFEKSEKAGLSIAISFPLEYIKP